MESPRGERRNYFPDLSKEEQCELVERAIERWMNKKFAQIGKSILGSVALAGFIALVKWLFGNGWDGK